MGWLSGGIGPATDARGPSERHVGWTPRGAGALFAALWLASAVAAVVHWRERAFDDVFILYRYAQNLAAGVGFVFNPGEPTFGATEPAVAVVLAIATRLSGLAIPLLGTLFTALSLAALGTGFVREAARRGDVLAGRLTASYLLASSFLWYTQGAAGPAVLAFLLGAAVIAERRPAVAGGLAAVAVAFRPDGLVGGAILGLLLWGSRRRLPWRYASSCAAGVAVLSAAAWSRFGSVVPQTLTAKQFHAAHNAGSWIGFGNFWGAALALFARGPFGAAAVAALLVGLAGAVVGLRRATLAERVVVLHGLALLVAYPLLRVPFFAWYAIPPVIAALWGLAQFSTTTLDALARRGAGRWHRRGAAACACGLLGALWIGGFARELVGDPADWRTIAYGEAGEWIRLHAPPEAALAAHEVGMLAFHSERRVEDLLGLVTPRSLPYAREGDLVGAFLAKPAEYYVVQPFGDRGAVNAIASRPWFRAAYREVARFDHPELGGAVSIFQRRAGAELPPPRPPARRPTSRAGFPAG